MGRVFSRPAKGAGIGGFLGGAGALAFKMFGFTKAGVAAGSMAAGIQAGIGNVAAGSIFAVCQSIGATGVLAASLPFSIVTSSWRCRIWHLQTI